MPYLFVSDFKFGMDRRRPQAAGVPGTLWIGKNCFVGRGGDIVRAKKFDPTYELPEGTFGMAAIKDQLYVFGSGSTPSGMPPLVQYQRLQNGAANMIRLHDVQPFDNALYAIAEFDDGNIYHYFDGSRVSDWDTVADGYASYETVAEALALKVSANAAVYAQAIGAQVVITAKEPGTAFTCVGAATDVDSSSSNPSATATQVTANVAEVEEVRATGSVEITGGSADPGVNYISSITVDGVELLAESVDWVSSDDATANALAVAINNNSAVSGYTATAAGAVVTIKAAVGTGSTPNGYVVATTAHGDVTTTDTDLSGGVDYVAPVAQVYRVTIAGDSFDPTDLWKITLNGTLYQITGRGSATGTAIFIKRKRVWSPAGGWFNGCVLEDPTDWTTTTDPSADSVALNLAVESENAQRLVTAANYQGNAAIFAPNVVLIYQLVADAENITTVDTLDQTGTKAARSVKPYGNLDVYYLDESGIRSIRARQGYNAAYVTDVGNAIDSFVQEWVASVDQDTLARAVAVVDPNEGRYLLAIGDRIFGLSYYPASKITAWTYLDPGFDVEDMLQVERKIYARSGDTIYLYGGTDGNTYPDEDELEAVVETPFMDARDPASQKLAEFMDAAVENEWAVEVLVDPNDTTKVIDLGVLSEVTYNKPSARLPGYGALMAFRFTCTAAGYASISNFALGFTKEKPY